MLETLAPSTVNHVASGQMLAASNVWFGSEAEPTPKRRPWEERIGTGERQKPRALLVDDAPDIIDMLAMLLRHEGYEVVSASSAPEALDRARDGQFDVVVSDIGMPGMNGYELAEALRALPEFSTVPMIAVTGFSMYDDRERALRSGFNAFISKPLNPMTLIEMIESLRGE